MTTTSPAEDTVAKSSPTQQLLKTRYCASSRGEILLEVPRLLQHRAPLLPPVHLPAWLVWVGFLLPLLGVLGNGSQHNFSYYVVVVG